MPCERQENAKKTYITTLWTLTQIKLYPKKLSDRDHTEWTDIQKSRLMTVSSQTRQTRSAFSTLQSLVAPPNFYMEETSLAMKQLNTNQAADAQGLVAEHLRNAPPTVVAYLRRWMP